MARSSRLSRLAAKGVGVALWSVGQTCRIWCHRDLRHAVRRDEGGGYIFASLHAHQIGAAMCGDRDVAAMVSRSGDGAMIVPTLRRFGIRVVRGSGGKQSKGGARATIELVRHVRRGGVGFLAVDGPGGPRGSVHHGVSMLAQKTGRPAFAVVVVPRRRWILSRTWDRLQIPRPFTRIDVRFSRPLRFGDGDTLESFADTVAAELRRLERWYDPAEAAVSEPELIPVQSPVLSQSPTRRAA